MVVEDIDTLLSVFLLITLNTKLFAIENKNPPFASSDAKKFGGVMITHGCSSF
jgi:hypothetical protein